MSRLALLSGALLTGALLNAPVLQAQNGTITGIVTDAGAQPLGAVQVTVNGTSIGALTQQNGRFTLSNVPAGTHTLQARTIGYRNGTAQATVAGGQTATVNFSLDQDVLALDALVVTGTPGATQRRAIGNSVSQVDAEAVMERAVIPDVNSLMRARTPGVRVGSTAGQVGGGVPITIRGVSSMNLGSAPLIYVDGVRIDNDMTKGPDTGSATGASAMSDINPSEIESIEVIKGPAAATLYGTEASAGVIQIITKKGRQGAPEFSLELSQGRNFMNNPARTLGQQYACRIAVTVCPQDQIFEHNMYNEANDYLRHEGRFAGLALPYPARDEDLLGVGNSGRYNLSVRGGNEQVRYFVSGALTDEVGVVDINTNDQRAFRANVSVLFPGDINVDVATGFVEGKTRYATVDNEGGVWHQLVWSQGEDLPGVQTPNGRNYLGFQERWPENYEATNIYRDYNRFTGSVQATHNATDWLTHRLTFGIDRGAETNNEYLPPGNAAMGFFPESQKGILRYGRPIVENTTFDYAASARLPIGERLTTNTSVGAQFYSKDEEWVENYGIGFPTAVQTVINQTEFGGRAIDFRSIENKSLGFYIQEELGWLDRFFLIGAVRADDNSAFGSEFDLQYYPKLQASWVVSEEPLFERTAFLSNLTNSFRLRAAWGQSGRQPDTFASQTLYGTFLGPNGNGLLPSTAGNTEVGPEVSSELELGFDAAFFDQRVSTEFSWYNTKTEDLLSNQALAPSTGGLPANAGGTYIRQANVGEMRSWGWDGSINARVWETAQHSFDLNVTGDFTKNEIVSLGEGVSPTANLQVGWPFPNISSDYIIRSAEFSNPATGVVNAATMTCDAGLPAVEGGPHILQGGPTELCSAFRARGSEGLLLGPAYPTNTFSVSPTLTLFEDLQVFAMAQGVYGRWIASVDSEFSCRAYQSCRSLVERTDPIAVSGALGAPFIDDRYRGRFLADFWRMREVGVRYNLPEGIIGRVGANRASLSVSGNNLWTIWQRNKTDAGGAWIYDPDYTIGGDNPQQTALYEMPGMASLNMSLRVTF